VLLVDDDPLVCQGLTLMLGSAPDLQIVGTVHDGDEVADAVERDAPQVVLLDVRMARQDGITTAAELARLPHAPRVLMLTTFDHNDVMLRSVRAGAAGLLLKTSSPQQIIQAVRDVAAGGGALSGKSTAQLLSHVRTGPGDVQAQARARLQSLSKRELEVAHAVTRGLSNAEIARELFVSEATVKSQLASAQTKLGVTRRVGIAVLITQAALQP